MAMALEELAKEMDIPASDLLKCGMVAYLEHELRLAEDDIADLREKYLVTDKNELEKHIKEKFIPSHPAWEDLIAWENTEQYIKKIKDNLARFR